MSYNFTLVYPFGLSVTEYAPLFLSFVLGILFNGIVIRILYEWYLNERVVKMKEQQKIKLKCTLTIVLILLMILISYLLFLTSFQFVNLAKSQPIDSYWNVASVDELPIQIKAPPLLNDITSYLKYKCSNLDDAKTLIVPSEETDIRCWNGTQFSYARFTIEKKDGKCNYSTSGECGEITFPDNLVMP